jgi:hypothetical protein
LWSKRAAIRKRLVASCRLLRSTGAPFWKPSFVNRYKGLQVLLLAAVARAEIDLGHQLLVDGLREDDVVEPPRDSVREDYPFDALVGGVVHGLLHVAVAQSNADGLDLDQLDDLAVDLHGQITERPPNREFPRQFGVLVVAEHLRQDVFDERHGVGFRHVAGLLLLDDGPKPLHPGQDPFGCLLRHGHARSPCRSRQPRELQTYASNVRMTA